MKPTASWNPQETLEFYDRLAKETPGMETTYRAFRKVLNQLFESRMSELQELFVGTSHSTICISGTSQETIAIPGVTLKIVPSASMRPAKIEVDYRFSIGSVNHTLTHTSHPPLDDFLTPFDEAFCEFKELRSSAGKRGMIVLNE